MCAHYVPHPQYGYMGYCDEHGMVFGHQSCEGFTPMSADRLIDVLKARGWVYCVDCRRALFDAEEVLAHLRRGELLTAEFMSDAVAAEEALVAD